ncbi:MAG: 2-C-methyl-D-erythritol 4-phosphate cytidylyltransferase [Balneola sp.]
MEKKAVIIPAAGSGTRMGSDIPKPFIKISGKSILQRSIECFLDIDELSQVVVATSDEYFDDCHSIFSSFDAPGISFDVIKGGKERQHSIWNALQIIQPNVSLVAIHDAVRPFVNSDRIKECFDVAQRFGGAVLGVPVKDTIKKIDEDSFIKETPSRSSLWQAQTPQVFKKDLIIEAYRTALKENFLGTDDASLVERMDKPVKMVGSNRENFKITYPIDLEIAKLIIENGL